MTLLKDYWFLVFAVMLFAMSCSKENISEVGIEVETPPTPIEIEVDVVDSGVLDLLDGSIYLECYSLVFPTEIVLIDDSVIMINNHTVLCDLLLEEQVASYTFPLTVADSEGMEIVFENAEEIEIAIEDCPENPIGGNESYDLLQSLWNSDIFEDCYTINYPVVILLGGEATLTVNNSVEFNITIEENTEVTGIELPVSVTIVESGLTVELNSDEDYYLVLDICN